MSEHLGLQECINPACETRQSHSNELRGHQDHSKEILTGEDKTSGTARFYSKEALQSTGVRSKNRV